MTQDDSRTHLPRRRAWREPSWRLHIRRHLDGPVGVQAQLGEPYREADGRDPNGDRNANGRRPRRAGTVVVATPSRARRRGPSGGRGPLLDRAGQGVPVLLEAGNQAPGADEKQQRCSVPADDLVTCLLPRRSVRRITPPPDYERWFWRDARRSGAPATNGQGHRQPCGRQRDAARQYTRAGLVERDAPPNPVCGAPVGMTDATVPVAPPAPLAVPVAPPAPTAPPLPPPLHPPAASTGPASPGGPTGAGRGRSSRRSQPRTNTSEIVVMAGHGTAATVRRANALVDRHRDRSVSTRHGATRRRLSGIGSPAVRRTVALCDGGVGGAAEWVARLGAPAGPTRRTDQP